jgi:hypothetical protein
MTQHKHRIVWLLLTLLLVAVAGCHRSATVTGKVTYGDRPVVYGSVIFFGSDRAAHSGVIAPDGSYTIEGIPPGQVRIAVISHDPSKGRSVLRGHKPAPPNRQPPSRQTASTSRQPPNGPAASTSGWFPLPTNYESPMSSDLSCTLVAGRGTHDIELK